MILVDALIACSLGALCAWMLTQAHVDARRSFARAYERDDLIDVYLEHAHQFEDMRLYERRSVDVGHDGGAGTFVASAEAKPYSDELIQTDVTITGPSSSIVFSSVDRDPSIRHDILSRPFCSPRMADGPLGLSWGHDDSAPTIVPLRMPVDPALPLTDIQVRNDIAYISADSTRSSDPDLIVVDIGDRDDPALLSSIDTGPGISAISLAGDRIYAAAASTAAQMHIIHMEDLYSPVLESKYRLPLPYATSSSPIGESIAYARGAVYLGTSKWDGDELVQIDVADPSDPTVIAGIDIGSMVGEIVVDDAAVYAATASQDQLIGIDTDSISDLGDAWSFAPSGWQRQEGRAIRSFEDSLVFGRTSGGFNISRDHELFSWTLSTTSEDATPSGDPISVDVAGGIYGIIVDQSHVFAASGALDREFQVYDRRLSSTSMMSYPLPVAPQTIACDRSILYVLARTAPYIYEITFNHE